MALQIDKKTFTSHLSTFYESWTTQKDAFKGADAISVTVGKYEQGFFKSTSLHLFLFGFEFPSTTLLFTEKELTVMTSAKKAAKYFEPLRKSVEGDEEMPVTLKVVSLTKEEAGRKSQFEDVAKTIKTSNEGKKVALMTKELKYVTNGAHAQGWMAALDSLDGVERVNGAGGVAVTFSVKDMQELASIKKAAFVTGRLMRYGLVPEMEVVIDEGKKVTHEALAERTEKLLETPAKIKAQYDLDDVETSVQPIIQSGGTYSVKASAQSSEEAMKYDLIIATIGVRFKNYCASQTRTFFIDPTKEQKQAYAAVVKAYEACLDALKPGKPLSDVRAAAKASLSRGSRPELANMLSKTCGHSIGLELKESLALNDKNGTEAQAGMVFDLRVAIEAVPHGGKTGKDGARSLSKYTIMIADTIVLEKEVNSKTGKYAVPVTKASMLWKSVAYYLEEESDNDDSDDDDASKQKKKSKMMNGSIPSITEARRQTRGATYKAELEKNRDEITKRENRQKAIMQKKMEEANRKAEEALLEGKFKKSSEVAFKEIKAYDASSQYPREVRNDAMKVDVENEVLFLPINNLPVPFHLNCIKNVSKNDGEVASFFRVNFYFPAKSWPRESPPSMVQACEKNKTKTYIKEMTFSAPLKAAHNLNEQYRIVKMLQKRMRARLREAREMADVVEQAALIPIRQPPRLQDLNCYPTLSGRKTQGTLEAHENGFRFRSIKGVKLDVLYNNIKHSIFQPCRNEMRVLIHFHLKNPILIQKKKCRDIQVYTEVMEKSLALNKGKRSMYDPDELDEEQRERMLRKKLNEMFTKFMKKVENLVEKIGKFNVEFDIPYKQMGFEGCPHKEMVFIVPCRDCLVNLTETPPFVLSLDDIDHVHFERVTMSRSGTSTFEMVVIFKNREKPPHRIDAIPMKRLDDVQAWLTEIDQSYTSGPANWNWKQVMKAVIDQEADGVFWSALDHEGEKKPIGWQFLGDHNTDSDVESEGSNFSESDFEEESESEDDSELEDWEMEEESEIDENSVDEDAMDWEEMDKQAERADRETARRRRQEDERIQNRRPKKKSRR
eukprot:g5807.t1